MNNTTVDINFHELCGKLRSMKLSSMADTLEKQLATPNSGLQSFDERISEIICSEWDTRYTKKFNRFLKKATLKYPAADIDESIYDADRFLDTGTIERLAACDWIDEGKNLLITGSTGSGKTYISNAPCIKKLAALDLLVIDDFGLMELDIDKCRNLFEVIDSRDCRHSTMVISQIPVSSWYELFQDNTYADACMDRIIHNAYRLEFNGRNMRNPSK